MLTQVYRYGPARQRIWKGFVVQADQPAQVLEQALRSLPQAVAERIRRDERQPACVWVDSGLRMLHTVEHRLSCFAGLRSNIQQLQSAVQRARGRLLPNAVRGDVQTTWDGGFCGDIHFLETIDDNEKEVFCNLLRQELPVLIATTGRSGVTASGVEAVGSRRLLQESRLLAARYFASVAPKHLDRVLLCLRHEQGISRLESLDVGPVPERGNDPGGVEVRFTDGQILLTSVRAQALFYQALLIQARRKARDGKRVGNVPQGLVERNRARAIADGMHASLELDQSRSASPHRNQPSHGPTAFRASRELLIQLLESLRDEFQVLECDFVELAPLVLGPGLRMLGLPGLQNESDWLRQLHQTSKAGLSGTLALLDSNLPLFSERNDDPITALNRAKFPSATERIQKWWASSLHLAAVPVGGNGHGERPEHSPSKGRSTNPSGTNAPNDRGPKTQKSSPSAQQSEKRGGNPKNAGSSIGNAVRHLAQTIDELEPNSSVSLPIATALLEFLNATSSNLIVEALDLLASPARNRIREVIKMAANGPVDCVATKLYWQATEVRAALDTAHRTGLSLLRITGTPESEQDVWNAGRSLSQSRPQSIETFLWNVPPVTNGQVAVELLLVSRNAGANS